MEENLKILLCEDDENLGLLLQEFLETKGYNVDLCENGQKGFEAFPDGQYDLCLLDVMMPKMDGFELASKIREISKEVPIIFLTARSMKEDVLQGFHVGADDYVAKPFSMEELMLRIEAIIRRTKSRVDEEPTMYKVGSFIFDSLAQTLTNADGEVSKLTTKESALLLQLCRHINNTLERSYAMSMIWPEDNFFNARSIDVYVTKLRKMLSSDPTVAIKNVHGKGYKLVVSSDLE